MIDANVFSYQPPPMVRNDGDYQVHWRVPKNLPYFDGHFPGMPILPAVAIIDASVYFLGEALQVDHIRLEKIHSCKITGVVTPDLELSIAMTLADKQARIIWRRKQDDFTVCDLTFSFIAGFD